MHCAGGVAFIELLREPLLEIVRQQKVTNTYLRNSASNQYRYTSSQATQHRDPTFKQALVEVITWRCRMQPPLTAAREHPGVVSPSPIQAAAQQQKPTRTLLQCGPDLTASDVQPYAAARLSRHHASPVLTRTGLLLGCATTQAYDCQDPDNANQLFCMGLGVYLPRELVCGAHLFKYSWRHHADQVLGFTNINDPANGLLLIK